MQQRVGSSLASRTGFEFCLELIGSSLASTPSRTGNVLCQLVLRRKTHLGGVGRPHVGRYGEGAADGSRPASTAGEAGTETQKGEAMGCGRRLPSW